MGARRQWLVRAFLVLASVSVVAKAEEPGGEGKPGFIRPGGNVHAWEALGEEAGEKVPRVGVEPRGFGIRSVGVRALVHQAEGAEPGSSAGVTAYERGVGILAAKFISARYFDELWFGTDGVDVTYGMVLQGAVGAYLPIHDHHGPFARLELRTDFRQQGGWSVGQVRFPGAQAGWTYSKGVTQWELLFHTSPALVGHVDTGLFRRDLAGLSYGGAMTLAWEALRFDADFSLISPTERLAPVAEVRAHTCGFLGQRPMRPSSSTRGSKAPVHSGPGAKDFKAAVCADVSLLSASGYGASGAVVEQQQTILGLSVLVGRFTRLDPP